MEDIQDLLDTITAFARDKTEEGAPAVYIPELAQTDPSLFSLSMTTVDGASRSSGDRGSLFSMQSVSKAAALCFAIEALGRDRVFSKIGMGPCSEPFNSIMKLEMSSCIPLNPFINAGAIVLAGMLIEQFQAAAIAEVMDFFSRLMGRQSRGSLHINEGVYRSEKGTADRNRALAYFLHNAGTLGGDVEEALDLYFKLCSIEVNTADLSVMGATLAAGGRNPVSGAEIMSLDTVYIVTGLMSVCGLYDQSAEFAVEVGVPAKSGVSGGIFCAVPGRMGLAVFSPPLNKSGNSVAGILALAALSRKLKLRGI
ncbi:MAG: glutaminase A [Treponema sp.]|jgi:glutaminase|nr:glutaminase A [Treponema sp.]